MHCGEIPRNCSREHSCGHCCFGCPSGDKQDATGTYLADAARIGAKIFTGGHSLPIFQLRNAWMYLKYVRESTDKKGDLAWYKVH